MRVRTGELVAAAGAVALLVVSFQDWYAPRAREEGLSAWDAFTVVDVMLGVIVALGLALALFQVVGRGPALPVALAVLTSTLALATLLLVAYRIVNQPGANDVIEVRLGAWLGLAAVAIVFWGAWKSMSDERPRPVDPPAPEPERRPAPVADS